MKNLSIVILLFLLSCERKFDEPPQVLPEHLTPTLSIAALKAKHVKGQFEKLSGDEVISGVVVADDRTGNFYKTIVLQDSTGGIAVKVDASNLFTHFPLGRKLFLRCKNLYLGDFNGLPQLGGGIDLSDPARPALAAIPAPVMHDHLVKADTGHTLQPRTVTLQQLGTELQDSFLNTLVTIKDFQFETADTGKPMAPEQVSSNLTLKNCAGEQIVLRTSGFAAFANVPVPRGKGSVTAIYTVFGKTRQLMIRDTSDLRFGGPRCGEQAGPAPEPEEEVEQEQPPAGSPGDTVGAVQLSGQKLQYDFDGLGGGLPAGLTVRTSASATALGDVVAFTGAKSTWSNTSGGFKNLASATGLDKTADTKKQDSALNRALGIRPVSATSSSFPGSDPGAAFVLKIANTLGKSGLVLSFRLQSLDASSTRAVQWKVDFGTGSAPTQFQPVATDVSLVTGQSAFSNVLVSVPLPASLANRAHPVWLRIVTTEASTGTGSRPTTAIDDLELNWQSP